MTALAEHLRRRIALEGPITVADYMGDALGHPRGGYYTSRDPIGAGGDFTTAPEISQIFGELIGLWLAQAWIDLGRPAPIQLVELGPGRGVLMADLLRAGAMAPGFLDAIELTLVETSPVLRQAQAERLKAHAPRWAARVAEIPDGPLLLVANEFFDALPIRQWEKTLDGWRERLVTWSDEAAEFGFTLSTGSAPADRLALGLSAANAPEGSVFEASPLSLSIMNCLAERIAAQGGAALIVDYGYDRAQAFGDTLQAVKAHRPVSVFETPGAADLTAHVDFHALARCAREAGAAAYGPIGQGAFLNRLGAQERLERLTDRSDPRQARALAQGVARLTEPDQMGVLFKALAVTGGVTPAGFATADTMPTPNGSSEP